MAKIVISYRRSDSEAMTGRIHDCLVEHYGDDFVFMDTHDIPPGVDFRIYIADVIHGADMLLAIIGRKWLGRRGRDSRIKDERDPVRAELETAMKGKVPVIPVLVDHALMPKSGDLPDKIKSFSYHNAVMVDAGEDFHVHMDRLIRNMDKILGRRPILPPDLIRWTKSLAQQLVSILSASDSLEFDEHDVGSPVTPVPCRQA
ncbi:MAG: toll/interleukin-1 receptor domain-containing protein [Xanthobacteraceae bacterium]|jgi:TIR domain